jgi:hypothetical protein
MNIDCSDVQYELKIGDSVRRSLIRHFHAFIIKQIKTRGFDADDPRLFIRMCSTPKNGDWPRP